MKEEKELEIYIEEDDEGWFSLSINGEIEYGLSQDDVIGLIKEALKKLKK